MTYEPSQTIHVDAANKLIDVRIAGLVSPEDAGWMGEEVRAAIRGFGAEAGQHVTLYDITHLAVAPAQTIEMVKGMFANPQVRPMWARKVAILTELALVRLQMLRLRAVRADIEIFEDRAAAIAWLLE